MEIFSSDVGGSFSDKYMIIVCIEELQGRVCKCICESEGIIFIREH